MALSRSAIETVLLKRVGGWWALVGFDVTTRDGTNADLTDPIATSCRLLGLTLADPTTVTDTDLVPVTQDQVDQILDVAEWRCVRTARANWDEVTEKTNLSLQDLNDIARRMEKTEERLLSEMQTRYGIGLNTIQCSSIDLNFAETDNDLIL